MFIFQEQIEKAFPFFLRLLLAQTWTLIVPQPHLVPKDEVRAVDSLCMTSGLLMISCYVTSWWCELRMCMRPALTTLLMDMY
jgi:hypothetical protein